MHIYNVIYVSWFFILLYRALNSNISFVDNRSRSFGFGPDASGDSKTLFVFWTITIWISLIVVAIGSTMT